MGGDKIISDSNKDTALLVGFPVFTDYRKIRGEQLTANYITFEMCLLSPYNDIRVVIFNTNSQVRCLIRDEMPPKLMIINFKEFLFLPGHDLCLGLGLGDLGDLCPLTSWLAVSCGDDVDHKDTQIS